MDLLSSFLGKWSKLRAPESAIRRSIAQEIRRVWGIDLPVERIRVRSGIAYIDANPLLKGELVLKKTTLLQAVNRELGAAGERRVTDIR